jgi:hypothetical protein
MPSITLISVIFWIITIFVGLFLLAIWLIEYDTDYQRAEATRLPISVISSHVLLALTGLGVWILYLVSDQERLAWVTVAILIVVMSFGLTMAVRWIGVYRSHRNQAPLATRQASSVQSMRIAVPAERHFPPAVVIGHGLFAAGTIVLVVLATLGVGHS